MKKYFLNSKKELKKIKSLFSKKINNLSFLNIIKEKNYLIKELKGNFLNPYH